MSALAGVIAALNEYLAMVLNDAMTEGIITQDQRMRILRSAANPRHREFETGTLDERAARYDIGQI